MKHFLVIVLFLLNLSFSFGQITANSFAPAVNFITGTTSSANPYFSAAGDLDGDGRLDVVVPNRGESYISVFKNSTATGIISTSTFYGKTDITTLLNPLRVCIADIDGDSKPDLVVFYITASGFSVFRNTSTGSNISFATRLDINGPAASGNGTVADLDGDGKADVLNLTWATGQVNLYRNTTSSAGSISFGAAQSYATGSLSGPAYVISKDFDNDGKKDVAVTNYAGTGNNTVFIYRNTTTTVGSITLANPISLATGSLPNGLTSADIDGDGKEDLIVANFNGGTLSVYRNTGSSGTISFASQVVFSTTGSQGPQEMGIADFDGDGKLDLVVGNTNSTNNVSVFRNTAVSGTISTSSFATRVDFSTGAGAEAFAADLDNDGKADIISDNGQVNTISVLKNLIVANVPTVAGTAINFSMVKDTMMTVTCDKGNGTRRLILCKQGNAVNSVPLLGNAYLANTKFGSGSQIGTGNFVVFNDTGNTFTLNGLAGNTTYYLTVFEFNGYGVTANYLTTTFATGSQNTKPYTGIFSLNNQTEKEIKIYPNPFSNTLHVVSINGNHILSVSLIDIEGKEVLKSDNSVMEVSSLKEGIYIAKIMTSSGICFQKVTK